MEASSDVWCWIFQTVNTSEKFENKRLEMASREWARFDRDGSLACKNCHDYNSMDWDNMSKLAQKQMKIGALCSYGDPNTLTLDIGTSKYSPSLLCLYLSGSV